MSSFRAVAVLPLVLLAAHGYRASVAPLSPYAKTTLRRAHEWHRGCPTPLSGLRMLTVTYRGWDGHAHIGKLVVNAKATAPLSRAFGKLYALHFPIHHLSFAGTYIHPPRDGDPTGSFECRDAVPSPCSGGSSTGSWSNHAYGLAVDINPVENPYVGCGQSRDPKAQLYRDRSRHRKGMVTPAVLRAFNAVGWGWGGSWAGDTKDYMHFSFNGH